MRAYLKHSFNPGKHHWLNWPMSIISILILYGLYTGFSGTTIGVARRETQLNHPHISSWYILISLIVFSIICMYGIYKWQAHNQSKFELLKHWKLYLSGVLIIWITNILSNFVFNPLVSTHVGNSNQKSIIESVITPGPIQMYTIISSIILAPFFEEFVFRYILIGPNQIKWPKVMHVTNQRRYIYATISIIIFTYLHMSDDITAFIGDGFHNLPLFLSLLHQGITYAVTGLVLSYIYMHTNDIRYSLMVHVTWNFISMFPIILLIISK